MKVCDGWTNTPILASGFNSWLREDVSLTLKLKNKYPDFEVMPIAESATLVLLDEYAQLNIHRTERAFVRDVLLKGNGQSVVFAHSVMPLPLLRSRWAKLTKLGKRPLGAVLFSNSTIKRSALVFKKINHHHALFQKVMTAYLPTELKARPTSLWARRSVFSLDQHVKSPLTVMVTEVFLPEVLNEVKVNVE